MPHTQHARYTVTAKAYGDGTPFLVFEPLDDPLPALGDKLLSIDLRAGTTPKHALALAEALSDQLVGLGITIHDP